MLPQKIRSKNVPSRVSSDQEAFIQSLHMLEEEKGSNTERKKGKK